MMLAAQCRQCLITHSQRFASSPAGREERAQLEAMAQVLRGAAAEHRELDAVTALMALPPATA